MIRSRYRELQEYLETKYNSLSVAPEQVVFDIDSLRTVPGGGNETEQGVHLCGFRYLGVFYMERLPLAKLPLLALYCHCFLADHDDTRSDNDLAEPKFDCIALDDSNLVDLRCEIEFLDPVYLTPGDGSDPDSIDWDGRLWDALSVLADVAETFDLTEKIHG